MRNIAVRATLLAALFATWAAPGAAGSRGIAISPTGANRASGTLTFLETEMVFQRCRVDLTLQEVGANGTAKSPTTVLANVTAARIERCEGGEVRALGPEARRPWRVTFVSYSGTLPSIESIRLEIRGVGFLISAPLFRCLYGGNDQATTVGGTRPTSMRFDERTWLPLIVDLRAFLECLEEVQVTGSLTFERTLRLSLV
jgi:hypothetical protein